MHGHDEATTCQSRTLSGSHEPMLMKSSPSPSKRKNLKKLSLSTAAAQKLGPSIQLSSPTKAVPLSAGLGRRMPMKLPALNIGLTRRPSLPVMAGKEPPATPMDKTFSVVKELQSGATDSEKETNNLEAYKFGPICVVPPNLWLYSEPTAKELKQFDVVVNVAREVPNPLLAKVGRPEASSKSCPASCLQTKSDRRKSSESTSRLPSLTVEAPSGSFTPIEQPEEFIVPKIYDGIEYVHMPWEHNQTLESDLPILTSFIDRKINHTNKRVLVHCQQGVSRSASLVIAYIMKTQALDVNDAYSFVKSKSSSIGPNMSLIYQLCEWGKSLQRTKSTAMHRRSFEIGGVRTAPSSGSFPGAPAEQRKRATSSVERLALDRTKSDQQVSTLNSMHRMSLSDDGTGSSLTMKRS